MKSPCLRCPFRSDIKPFLRHARAEELAISAENPYNSFTCHKTLGSDDETGETMVDESSKLCAGFLSMQININGDNHYSEEGFEPSPLVFEDAWEMIDHYDPGLNPEAMK